MNFMIWGGLNGIGMVIYKLWHPLTVYWRFVVVVVFWGLFVWLWDCSAQPVFRIAVVWVGCLMLGTFVAMIGHIFRLKGKLVRAVELSWSVLQTFVFITFTRLFFRSGSNLDPAEANETAWQTAKNMVIQIGSEWNTEQIPNVCSEYKLIFGLIVLGMIIHWLPTNFKRRYRLCFAKMPLIAMLLVSVFVIFVVYQFVTADLQKFIYFQF